MPVLLLFSAGVRSAAGGDGAWTSVNNGNWSTPGNWAGGNVADGAGSKADFSTLDLQYTFLTVTQDVARTIGSLVFGDTDPTSYGGWLLTGSALTLSNSAATPTITVNAINGPSASYDTTNDVILSSVLTGGQGFLKKGVGTLTLTAANTMGQSQIDDGTIGIGNATALGAGNQEVRFNGGGVRVWAGGPTFANTNRILTTGFIVSSNGNYDAYNSVWLGSGTMYFHNKDRLTMGGTGSGIAGMLASFTGTMNLSDSTGLLRINLGSGNLYNCSAITFDTGTNGGRFAARMQIPGTWRIGALLGGPNTRLESSENAGGTLTTWEVGALNLSTTFEGRIMNYTDTAGRVGALNKVGTGKLTLTNPNNNYRGNTTVSQGVLALSGGGLLPTTPVISVLSAAVFDVSARTSAFSLGAAQALGGGGVVTGDVATASGTLAPGSPVGTLSFSNNLALGGVSTVTNLFELTSPGVADSILVAGNLTFSNGAVIVVRVVPTGAVIPNGTYTLFKWGGTLPEGDVSTLTLEYPAQTGTLTLGQNLATKEIYLTVSGVSSAANLVWRGDAGPNYWDFTTANWRDGATPAIFKGGDKVTFDHSGSNGVPVDMTAPVNPGSIVVNASKDYVFGSSTMLGKITGTTGLLKTNTGKLTVTTDNDYTGDTLIAAGTLQIGDGLLVSGSLGGGNLTNNGTLIYNRGDNITNATPIRGTGALMQVGYGDLLLNSAGSYSGGTTLSNGMVSITGFSGLGTAPVNFAGGTLRTYGGGGATTGLSNELNVVTGGALQCDGTGTYGCVLFGGLRGNPGTTLDINHSATGPDRVRLYAQFTNNANLNLNGTGIALAPYASGGNQVFNGVIGGPGQIVNRAGGATTYLNAANTYSGGTTLTTGALALGVNSVSTGGTILSGPLGTGPLIPANEGSGVGGNGTVFASGGSRTVENPINFATTTNEFTLILGGSNNLVLSGPISLGATNRTFQVNNTTLSTLSGLISDAGGGFGINKTGAGILALSAVNTYTGPTTISAGTLQVNGQIDVGGATVTGGTLGGSGTILGPVAVQPGAALAPGASVGTLTINSDFTLAGNLSIEVNKSQSPSNDLVVASGILTNAGTGTVTVTNLGPALAVGDRFKLFNKPLLNGGALAVTGGGVFWANNLQVDGTIAVVPQPVINSVVYSSGKLIFSGTNGIPGNSYVVLSSTNAAAPMSTWVFSSSGTFDSAGAFDVTNPVTATPPYLFYRLRTP